ncbi:NAD(P)H-dependent flavin oxidoreductase [Bacteroidota bacterium]
MKKFDKIWERGQKFLGVKYPIISGGMTWISNFELAKAVSDNGAFPVLAAGNMPLDEFEKEVDKCVEGINKPFAVNLITIAPNVHMHLEILKSKNVDFVVFAGGFPKKQDISMMKNCGKKVMAFASTESIANILIDSGVDALILEGSEAGGHIGHVSLIVLLQQVLFKFRDFPVFVAGGIATGEMIAHLLLMGAYGVQLGTKFVMSEECTAHENFKKSFIKAKARQAISTPQYSSDLPVVAVRALKNKAMSDFGDIQLDLLKKLEKNLITRIDAQYEVEKFWVGSLRDAVINGDVEKGSLMAGQSVGLVNKIQPLSEIINELVNDTEKELERVANLISPFLH